MQIQKIVKYFSLTSFIHNRKFQRCKVLQKFEKIKIYNGLYGETTQPWYFLHTPLPRFP